MVLQVLFFLIPREGVKGTVASQPWGLRWVLQRAVTRVLKAQVDIRDAPQAAHRA